MNFTLFRGVCDYNMLIARLVDLIDEKTLIIIRDSYEKTQWQSEIVRAKSPILTTIQSMGDNLTKFRFITYDEHNQDEYITLTEQDYKNVILADVWCVYRDARVPEWLSIVKTNNPNIRFIGLTTTGGETYKTRIDPRYGEITLVYPSGLAQAMNEKMALPIKEKPQTFLHTWAIEPKEINQVQNISYRGSKNRTSHISRTVGVNEFLDSIAIAQDGECEIKAYCAFEKAIELLTQSAKRITTAMIFFPNPGYGFRLTHITHQLKELFFDANSKTIERMDRENTSGISLKSQKTVMFFDEGDADKMKPMVNWYMRPKFTDGTRTFAMRSFKNAEHCVLAIENQCVDVDRDILSGCVNVVLFGSNKTDLSLINQIRRNLTGDINLIIPYVKGTVDESNVVRVVSDLNDDLLTVIKHDLSS